MKKSLFLLPLLGGFVLSACQITIGNKTFKFFEKDDAKEETKKEEESNEKGTGSGGNQNQDGGGNQNQGGGSTIEGTLLATVTLTANADLVDAEADPAVFAKNDYKVTISRGECVQTVAQAVGATGSFEFRVYAKMDVTFSGPSAFSKPLIKYSSYTKDGKTYYFDYEDLEGATNEYDNSKYEAVVTLNSASTSFSVNCSHQTRIASVSFYA